MKKTWKLAGINVRADFTYPYLAEQCRFYESNELPELSVIISKDDIRCERERSNEDIRYSDGYCESMAFYRQFVTAALDKNVLLMHGSAVSFYGKGYIFTAPSGTGKSTHSRLCKEYYGDKVSYINDDKPLLRYESGVWYVYGSPWDGKHHLSENVRVPLGGICQLVRGESNTIRRIDYDDTLRVLMTQIYRPDDAEDMKKTLDLMLMLAKTPSWQLKCNISEEAAKLSLGTMGDKT